MRTFRDRFNLPGTLMNSSENPPRANGSAAHQSEMGETRPLSTQTGSVLPYMPQGLVWYALWQRMQYPMPARVLMKNPVVIRATGP